MLQIRNVSKKYRGATVNAVQNLDLEVKKGEIFGFLGPNGAGKTTTIKMIVGLLAPDQGEVVVNGHNVVRQPLQAKASLGFVPDNPDLYQRLTGMEYLNLIGDVFQVPRNERVKRIGYYLDMFNLGHAVNDLVQSFSHGMQQKLALIGALMHTPPLFVLDEPMVGLDPKSAHQFKEILKEHTLQGNAVFFSTHILEVAERLCDRVGIIQNGKLIACGTVDELKAGRHGDAETLERLFLELTEAGDDHEHR